MSDFVDAVVKDAKSQEVVVAEAVEAVILSALKNLPLALPDSVKPVAEAIDLAVLPEVKALIDGVIAKLK